MPKYLEVHKAILVKFWQEFGGDNRQYGVSTQSASATIKALIEIGNTVLLRSDKVKSSYKNRSEFNNHKHWKRYQYRLCFVCQSSAQVRHHIIWIKNGGRNHKKNIIGLCNKCHAKIHPWLDEH